MLEQSGPKYSFKTPGGVIDYASSLERSVWGIELEGTGSFIRGANLQGRWLNLCAGDGRYNSLVLDRCESLTVVDLDPEVLVRLTQRTPENLRSKLVIEHADITERFGFHDSFFDGAICTGSLHLFDPREVKHILSELTRVIRSGGELVLDFAADVRREKPDGSLYHYPHEHPYSMQEGRDLVFSQFPGATYEIRVGESPKIEIDLGDLKAIFTCKGFVTRISISKSA